MDNVKKEGLVYSALVEKVFSVDTGSFEKVCLEIFHYQYANTILYRTFVDSLKRDPKAVKKISDIPFLPIEFFKTQNIIAGNSELISPDSQLFLSSGTTGISQSKHFVSDVDVYEISYRKCFELFYGDIKQYSVLALLPSYLEREGSSLIYMTKDLIERSENEHSGFYLDNMDALIAKLEMLEGTGQKSILLGVTYALLDLVEKKKMSLKNTIVMETGGMKGKRKEMVREELHEKLCEGFGVDQIHSEYGMTELLSQAYSKGKGIFYCPPWMRVLVRDTEDPFRILDHERGGGINIIDLANINSCCFIATQDLGRTHADASFEVLGRYDNSDIRGCNLLVE